jgi:hypothetical protein
MTPTHKSPQYKVNNLSEGLQRSDLKDMIDHLFTVDQFQSKMGDDKNTIVLRFRAADKEPAIDLMEFLEKGYDCILDADTSSGEERDGRYSVFVEIQRTSQAPQQIDDILEGVGQLCDCEHWRFRWYKDVISHDFTPEEFKTAVPCDPSDYEHRIKAHGTKEVSDFFDQGAIDSIEIDEDRNILFKKPFAESLMLKLIAIGEYDILKQALNGPLQLDESSRGQIIYLNKYLGNYDINKIEGHFLIRNGSNAVIVLKDRW